MYLIGYECIGLFIVTTIPGLVIRHKTNKLQHSKEGYKQFDVFFSMWQTGFQTPHKAKQQLVVYMCQ